MPFLGSGVCSCRYCNRQITCVTPFGKTVEQMYVPMTARCISWKRRNSPTINFSCKKWRKIPPFFYPIFFFSPGPLTLSKGMDFLHVREKHPHCNARLLSDFVQNISCWHWLPSSGYFSLRILFECLLSCLFQPDDQKTYYQDYFFIADLGSSVVLVQKQQ